MILKKHIKLLRKFLGNITRPRFGWKNHVAKCVKFLYLLIGWPFELVGDMLFFWRRAGRGNISDPQKILIVKIDQLGDVLFSTFLLPLIKKKYPNVEIDYLINEKAQGALKENPFVANIYFSENIFLRFLPGRGNGMVGLLRIIKKNRETWRALRARRYDVVINARAFAPSSNVSLRRLGGALIAFDISEQSFLADYWADYDFEEEEWKDYLNLLGPLHIDISNVDFREEFYNIAAQNPFMEVGSYAVVSPVSFDAEKNWGKGNWQKLVAFLTARGMHVALTGMPSQREYLESLAPEADGEKVRIFTDMTLAEFGALMKGAAFFVGIESFPAHLSLACGRRSIFLVNNNLYYLKGHSPKRFAVDARSMLPVVSESIFFDVKVAEAKDIETAVVAISEK